MTIEIPDYRAKSRNQTTRKHWIHYKRAKSEIAALFNPYIKRKTFLVPVQILIQAYYKGKRHVDTSNLDDKIIVDVLMECGVILDDRAYENPEVIKRVIPEAGTDKLVVIITPMKP